MKKRGILCIILVFCVALAFTGCGKKQSGETTKQNSETTKQNSETTNKDNPLSAFVGTYNLNVQGQSVPYVVKLQSDGTLFAGFDKGGASGTLKPIEGSKTKFSLVSDPNVTVDFSESGKVKYITPAGTWEGPKQ